MGFKKMKTNLTFTDLSLLSSIEKNRAIQRMEQINTIVNWSRIDTLIMKNYPVGKSAIGNDAYPPLVLIKCLLLQQWSRSTLIPHWKPRSTIGSLSKRFWDSLLMIPLPIIPLSLDSENGCPRIPCA